MSMVAVDMGDGEVSEADAHQDYLAHESLPWALSVNEFMRERDADCAADHTDRSDRAKNQWQISVEGIGVNGDERSAPDDQHDVEDGINKKDRVKKIGVSVGCWFDVFWADEVG